jgi:hypothetical protein
MMDLYVEFARAHRPWAGKNEKERSKRRHLLKLLDPAARAGKIAKCAIGLPAEAGAPQAR